jgi:dUTP pyrophosphatase
MEIKFKGNIPTYGTDGSIGLDLVSNINILILAHSSAKVGTGTYWQPEPLKGVKVGMIVQSRSGLAFNSGIEASNAGVIDEDYRGEIKVKLYNNSDEDFFIKKGDRIAQGIVHLIPNIVVVDSEKLEGTERGQKGFGSTGV